MFCEDDRSNLITESYYAFHSRAFVCVTYAILRDRVRLHRQTLESVRVPGFPRWNLSITRTQFCSESAHTFSVVVRKDCRQRNGQNKKRITGRRRTPSGVKKLAVKFPDSHGLGLKNTKIRYVTPKVSKFAELPSPMAN